MKLTHELIHIAGHRPDHKLALLGQVGQFFLRPASLVFGHTYEALTGKEKFYSTTCKIATALISTLLAPLTVVMTVVGFGLLYISKSHSRLVEVVKGVAARSFHAVPSSPSLNPAGSELAPLSSSPSQLKTPVKKPRRRPLPPTPASTPPVSIPLPVSTPVRVRGQRPLPPTPAPSPAAPSIAIPVVHMSPYFEEPLPASPVGSIAGTPQAGAGGAGREIEVNIPNSNPSILSISGADFRFFVHNLNLLCKSLVPMKELRDAEKERSISEQHDGLNTLIQALLANCKESKGDYVSINAEIKLIAESIPLCKIKVVGMLAFAAIQKRLGEMNASLSVTV